MGFVRCDLPHPLFLVLPDVCMARAQKDYEGIPLPASAAEVEQDFLMFSESGIITLLDDKQPENLRISFCTSRYELVCGLTSQKDAYIAQRLAPLSLRTHNLITRGAVLTFPHTWGVYPDLPDLNSQVYSQSGAGQQHLSQTGIEALQACWQQARMSGNGQSAAASGSPAAGSSGVGLSPAQLSFLANVDTLIELACQVELEQAARMESIPVRSVAPALERATPNTFCFQLAALAEIRTGEYLQAGSGDIRLNGNTLDGVVVESAGTSLTLRFRQPVDLAQLQKVKWLAPKISTRQYSIQHEAVGALRNGESLNPALLPLIVDNRFEDFQLPVISSSSERPNLAQKTLIERALVVPDMLLALGPPGTGKTDTIREIVARQAAQGKKVLVTSKNNKAVDNVLEGLENVQVLRIGREEAVSAGVRPVLIDNSAAALCQNILAGIQPVQANLDGLERIWPKIQEVLERLEQHVLDWRQARTMLEQERTRLARWQRSAYSRVSRSIDRQVGHYQQANERLNQAAQRAEGLSRRLDTLQVASQAPLIGPFFTLLAGRFAADWQQAFLEYREALQEVRASRQSVRKVWESYQQYVTGSDQALIAKGEVVKVEERLADVHNGIVQAKAELTLLTETLPLFNGPVMGRPVLRLDSPDEIEASLKEWRSWYTAMMSRQGLLAEWRGFLQERPQALHSALVRGADVIGATCIGIATDARFEDLEFDLAIVDEAGQIQAMDLLVPLVRARRAVLVGDHLQLPPVVEPEIIQKIRENEPENQQMPEWLEKSLFERLIWRSLMKPGRFR